MLQERTMPKCRDCNQEWTFTVLEQALFAERSHQNDPSRCPKCRANRQAKRERGETRGHNAREERIVHKATCSQCGGEARLPFKPREDRAVLCSDCHRKARLAG
ncbi:zinc-binding protein [bacterium CPR1]|nr:zinc-binding protein [bacterium CPR1]